MTETRKLAAVMFTDISGYMALMSRDEQKVLSILEKNRTRLKRLVKNIRDDERFKELMKIG